MRRRAALACAAAALALPARAAGPFEQPQPGLDEAGRAAFVEGRELFQRPWSDGSGHGGGLGPLYNRLSCVACHPDNGRGRAPGGADERMQSMLVRLSRPGRGEHGGPRPHPAYGDQLNEDGVPGVRGEGRAALRWQPVVHRLADDTSVELRRPVLQFRELGYGPLRGVLSSARVGSPVYGLGLLEAVPEAALRTLAATPQPDGVRGRLNEVWDPVSRRMAVGRFGWKANTATLQAQVVQAALGDLGLTSAALPAPNCTARQIACRAKARGSPVVELSAAEVARIGDYLRQLAVPAPRGDGDAAIERGRRRFEDAGCTVCHRPLLPQLEGRPGIAAYTDLLLHDLGPGLADGRPDYRAGPRDWRTPPLWGIGLTPQVNEHDEYLHDGRARGLFEAVLWHDGEARAARQRFERLTPAQRAELLAFVASR